MVAPADVADVVAVTDRLVLRAWRETDAEPFAAINTDPDVMRYVGGTLTRQASDDLLDRLRAQFEAQGFGRCAVEDRATGDLLGFVGLGPHVAVPDAVEIGCRLASYAWSRGLATEGALVMRDLAFDRHGLDRIISVAVPANPASLAVMRKIGMRHWRDLQHDGLLLTIYEMHPGDRV